MKPTIGSILRLLFKPRTLRDCVRWGLHNLPYYQSRVSQPELRNHRLDEEALEKAVTEATSLMRKVLNGPM